MRIAAVSLLLLLPAAAGAQRVIDPSEPPTTTPAAPPDPYAAPGSNAVLGTVQPPPPPAQQQPTGGQARPAAPGAPGSQEEEGLYLGGAAPQGQRYEGQLPEVHVVQKGDTLWDICAYYFGDAWKWPEVWGMNPAITNPHWIYPGDLVRLLVGGGKAAAPTSQPEGEQPTPEIGTVSSSGPRSPTSVELRQLAFVSTDDLKISSKVVGSTQDKTLLSASDEVYLEYPAGHPPQVGTRYSIYAPTREIKHPQTKATIGHYVLVRGELEILEVKKDKRALGIIRQVNPNGVVERGDRVGALKTELQVVEPVPGDRSLEGVIAGIIGGGDALIGEWHVVFIDRGSDDGVKVGHRMLVVRRGDALPSRNGEMSPAGKDDRRFPDHYLGSLVIVEVGKKTAVGLMLRTDKELLLGDHVLMRRPAESQNP